MLITTPAYAHLMVAQNGTINIVGNGAFLVLSVPVSAFDGVDDDGDKMLSRSELTKHRATLIAAVSENVKLFDKEDPRPLQGIMLSPVAQHNNPMAPSSQLIVMGRFLLATDSTDLNFHFDLFGTKAEEQQQKMRFTFKEKSLRSKAVLMPKKTRTIVFPKEEVTTSEMPQSEPL